ncbi:MAG: restriction endonuclease subunit S [Methylobacter sp.]|jgi:type I restriction enzyme S subunit
MLADWAEMELGELIDADWPVVRLGDFCTKVGSGSTPNGGANVYLEQGDICLIRSQNVHNDGFKLNGLVYITQESADKLKNVVVEENDILLNITGDSVARVCLAKSEYLPARVNQHVAIIRPDPEKFDSRYLRYLLVSPTMQNLLLSIASIGATRNALTKGMIESLEVCKPPISIQKSIADNLEALDLKIDINTQTNQTLEAIAQAIFKSWFVDFEPVKAKMAVLEAGGTAEEAERAARCAISGKDEAALTQLQTEQPDAYAELAQTAALFPSAMQDSELGEIPEGWGVTQIKNVGKVVTDKTPAKNVTNAYLNTGIPFITPTDVDNSLFIISTLRGLSESGTNSIKKSLIPAGSICVTCIGSQMGKACLVPFDSYTNQQINSVVVNKENWRNYLFFNLRGRREEIFHIGSSGSTMPIINKSTFEKLLIASPSDCILNAFDSRISHSLSTILLFCFQNTTLAILRDTLLPKLLSGEIDLSQAADVADEVSV